jgi:tetraacyldisaccharide 4'-kinase
LYLLVTSLRNLCYNAGIFRHYKLNAKVISVGNITWGGTGKTPAIAFIASVFLRRGLKPAILIRGYGKDEEALLSNMIPGVPLIIGKDRIKTGNEATRHYKVNTVLLDDGFQYRRLKRDIDIVCIDSTNPFGNGWLIPAGSLREGLMSLRRADVFLLTKVDLVEDREVLADLETRLKKINPDAITVKSIHRAKYFYRLSDNGAVDIRELKNKNVALISAIGRPSSFEKTVLNLGLKIARHFAFRDHYWYKEKDLKKIGDYCKENNIDTIITTEKDAVKLRAVSCQLSAVSFLALHIELQIIENEQGFYNRLFGIYNS